MIHCVHKLWKQKSINSESWQKKQPLCSLIYIIDQALMKNCLPVKMLLTSFFQNVFMLSKHMVHIEISVEIYVGTCRKFDTVGLLVKNSNYFTGNLRPLISERQPHSDSRLVKNERQFKSRFLLNEDYCLKKLIFKIFSWKTGINSVFGYYNTYQKRSLYFYNKLLYSKFNGLSPCNITPHTCQIMLCIFESSHIWIIVCFNRPCFWIS